MDLIKKSYKTTHKKREFLTLKPNLIHIIESENKRMLISLITPTVRHIGMKFEHKTLLVK